MSPYSKELSLDPQHFTLWAPERGMTVPVGPEQTPVPLPVIPLPIHPEALKEGNPSANAMGEGVNDYLRQFPDCLRNRQYAELLRDAYPHYLADLGAQILLIDHREVDSESIRQKISYMKILALLDPGNSGLRLRLGIEYYQLSQMFSEFADARSSLLKAMGYLQEVLKADPENLQALNVLGRIDYLFGDYPSAVARWRQVVDKLPPGEARDSLSEMAARLQGQEPPETPLIDDYEYIGAAMDSYGQGHYEEAVTTLDIIEERGQFTAEIPCCEFYHFLGMCRSRMGNTGGAFEALEKALELNPDYTEAREAMDRLLETGKSH
ncbi:hypothetical protein [Trichloromonas sp.]|uniref:tetratricopeptide repeat protein n=1 Tax=Trichloromonas sp. TaxID=3069249 RepID=UPI002A46D0E8|nr:hypothetical protein [Trichloromonas sp.]